MARDIKNNKGQIVGFITEDGILCKKVKRSKHLLRTPEGWGIDEKIFEEPFSEVRIIDTENQIMYIALKETWLEKGITIDRGFGKQIVLPLHEHQMRDKKQPSLI